MKVTPYRKEKWLYRFDMTEAEAIRRICDCLSKTNPDIRPQNIRRSLNSKEFKVEYVRRSDGSTVRASLGIPNLKRIFGTRIIALTDDGLWFIRKLSKNVEIPR